MENDKTHRPLAANDNEKDDARPKPKPQRPASAAAHQRDAVPLDQRLTELNQMTDEVFELAQASFDMARKMSYDPEAQGASLKQGVNLASCHAKLVTTMDRHRKALREES